MTTFAFFVLVCMSHPDVWCFNVRSPRTYNTIDACFAHLTVYTMKIDRPGITTRNEYCFIASDKWLVGDKDD